MERPKMANSLVGGATGLSANTVSSVASSTSSSSSANAAGAGVVDKRKKLDEPSKESRIDAKQVIDDLIKSANLEHDVHDQGKHSAKCIHLVLYVTWGLCLFARF